MATFRVGQRVRIIGCTYTPEDIGKEGIVIDGPDDFFDQHGQIFFGYCVKLDGQTEENFGYMPEHLSPIQPERNRVIEWSECLWSPHHNEEHA